MITLSYRFDQDSSSLELSGMPDVSNGDSQNTIGILSLLYYYYYHNIMDSFKIKLIVLIIVLVFNLDLFLYFKKVNLQS